MTLDSPTGDTDAKRWGEGGGRCYAHFLMISGYYRIIIMSLSLIKGKRKKENSIIEKRKRENGIKGKNNEIREKNRKKEKRREKEKEGKKEGRGGEPGRRGEGGGRGGGGIATGVTRLREETITVYQESNNVVQLFPAISPTPAKEN